MKKRGPGNADIGLLIGAVVIGFALGRWQDAARTQNRLDPFSSAVQTVLSPIAQPINRGMVATADFFTGVTSVGQLRAENRQLREAQQATALYTETVTRLQTELDQLRSVVNLAPTYQRQTIVAEIVAYLPQEKRISLNRGRQHGVRPGLAVVVGQNLVGMVQTVETSRSQVLLVTSASFMVGALNGSRNPPSAGIAQGGDGNTLNFTLFEPNMPLEIGDTVLTSGFGDRIPRGIVIGRVLQRNDSIELGTRRAVLDPAVSIGTIREVRIVL